MRSPSVPVPAARGSRFSRPSGSRSRSQAPSSTRLISAWSSSERSRASSHRSSSSLWSQNLSWLRSRPRSPARVQVSFLSVAPSHVKSSSPLESVPSLYSSPASYHAFSFGDAPPCWFPFPFSCVEGSLFPLVPVSTSCLCGTFGVCVLLRESSCWSRRLKSPSRRVTGSGRADEDRQKEQSSLVFSFL